MDSSLVSSGVDLRMTLIRKERRLPLPGEVLVREGDPVEPDTPVAKISLRPGIPWVIPLSRLLGIEPEALPEAMLKQVGDRVRMKEIIAKAKSGLYGQKEYESPTDGIIEEISAKSGRIVIREEFGKEEPPVSFDAAFELRCKPRELRKYMLVDVGREVKRGQIIAKKGEAAAFFTLTARAPISGVVAEINEQTGYVTIARPFKEVIVNAYIRGRVARVIPQRGVVVESPGVRITGVFGVGRETHGVLKVLTDSPSQPITADMIDDDCADKILVGGSSISNDAIDRALAVGARGLIVGSANYLHLVEALGVKLGVGITGQEDVSLTVVLMEGFGDLAMRDDAFYTLKRLEGHEASLNGRTQIRAGAIRPEVVVTFPDYDGPLSEVGFVDEEIAVGERVRIINEPYFGRLGRVVALPREEAEIETGARVPVAVVELEDGGGQVTVPRKNLEIF